MSRSRAGSQGRPPFRRRCAERRLRRRSDDRCSAPAGRAVGQRRDPGIVRWYGRAQTLQFQTNVRVCACRCRRHRRDLGQGKVTGEPVLVADSLAGLADTEVVLAKDDAGHYQPVSAPKAWSLDRSASFGPGGQGVGIEDHARSSGESFSNSSSIKSRTRRFSSERSDSAPKPAIHGGSAAPAWFAREHRRKLLFERFGEEAPQGDATGSGERLGLPEQGIGKLNRRFHVPIFP